MTYSASKYRKLMSSSLALVVAGIAAVFWLIHNRVDPVAVGMFRVVFAVVVVGLALWAYTYRDEVQRQAQQKRWFLGSMAGIAAMIPVVVSLQTH